MLCPHAAAMDSLMHCCVPRTSPLPAEPNDIPLARLQYQFNERILAAATAQVGRGRWRAVGLAASTAERLG